MNASVLHKPMIVTFANYKGGVAKTESTYRVARQFASNGLVPWLIDIDPQANLTRRCNAKGLTPNVGAVLGGAAAPTATFKAAAHDLDWGPGVDKTKRQRAVIVPSEKLTLENVAIGLMQRNFDRLEALATAIQASIQFVGGNPILIDTPPNASILTLNALVASTHVVICSDPEDDGIDGIGSLIEIVAMIKKRHNPDLQIMGVLATRVNENVIRHTENLSKMRGEGMPRLLGQIPIRAGKDADSKLDEAYKPVAELIWRFGGSNAGSNQ